MSDNESKTEENEINFTRINQLARAVGVANGVLVDALREEIPTGSIVWAIHRAAQRNPTRCKVLRHEGGSYALVRLKMLDTLAKSAITVPARNVFATERAARRYAILVIG